MKVLVYSTKTYERPYLEMANQFNIQASFLTEALSVETAWQAKGFDAVCIFTHDVANAEVLTLLHNVGVQYLAIRAAGYDNVDLNMAEELGICVANVPAYSPYSVAEHAMALVLALNRRIVTASQRVHNYNFTIDGLVGSDLHGKTAGIIGTGKIGSVMAKILHGFGCHLVGFDLRENPELVEKYNMHYTDLKSLCFASDIISVHLCLTEQTKHLINRDVISYMRPNAIFVNTARGAIVDTDALADALQSGIISAAGLDVYENEKDIFFQDRRENKPGDPLLQKLLSLPNVILTPHQAFATREALQNIALATFTNLHCWANHRHPPSELSPSLPKKTAPVSIL